MKPINKLILIIAIFAFLEGGASAATTAGDHQFTLSGGISKSVGAAHEYSNAGPFVGLDYLYYPWNGYLGLGVDAGFSKLGEKENDIDAGAFKVRVNNNPRFASVAALARFNLMPDKEWTPFLIMGLGTAYNGNRINTRVSTPLGVLSSTTKDNFWRITGIFGAGADWYFGNCFLGTHFRFQTFAKSTSGITGGLRTGYKF